MNTTHRAVEKALEILTTFIPYNKEAGTVEVSNKLGYHRSTVNRLMHVLTRKGFLQQNEENKKFQLGPTVLYLGMALEKSLEKDLINIARPIMEQLRDKIQETVVLEVFTGGSTIVAHVSEANNISILTSNIGDVVHIHAAAGGKAILAFSNERVRQRVLNKKLKQLTPNTITSIEILQKQFQDIRKSGLSFDNQEHIIGINAVGAPIFNHEGKPVAALVIGGSSHRIKLTPEHPVAVHLKSATARISEQLFFNPE
ncbi:MAG: IclR family transcriptional regulator [Desulfatitalea sp.]|nr:IclR family transcriptional regulator [Desulfatitalea sp.]NNK02360.1 IclR family transcriptional regulator [Desulfatitalea sp.]